MARKAKRKASKKTAKRRSDRTPHLSRAAAVLRGEAVDPLPEVKVREPAASPAMRSFSDKMRTALARADSPATIVRQRLGIVEPITDLQAVIIERILQAEEPMTVEALAEERGIHWHSAYRAIQRTRKLAERLGIEVVERDPARHEVTMPLSGETLAVGGLVRVNVSLEPHLRDLVAAVAERMGTTMTAVVAEAVRRAAPDLRALLAGEEREAG